MEKIRKYTLELTESQAMLVQNACEMLARLQLGQYWIISDQMLDLSDDKYREKKDIADKILEAAGFVLNGESPWGRVKGEKNETFYRAISVHDVIRHARAWKDHPEGGFGVCFDKPMKWLQETLPECTITEETR